MGKIQLREYDICLPNLGRAFHGYRILQISDIHLGRGDRAESILETLSRLQVDLVALTGDIVHREEHFHLIRPFLKKLLDAIHPADGVFSVWGNHDKTVAQEEVAGLPIRWLHNEAVQITREPDVFNLIGVNQKTYQSTDLFHALAQTVPETPMILLAHYPSTVYWLNGIIDLVLAGHTHAGQVKIPGLPFTTNDQISWRYAHGHSTLGKTQLVVSAGIGTSGPVPFRFFAPPEITLVNLQ
jgi:uncharacterized protein